MSRIIKVEVGVISQSPRLILITLTETLIILNITKTESNNCFITHWMKKKMEVMFLLLYDGKQHKEGKFDKNHAAGWYMTRVPMTIQECISLTWSLYNLQLDDITGTDFENSLCAFSQSEKRWWVQWIIRLVICAKSFGSIPGIVMFFGFYNYFSRLY